jgi:hypothetical protein
MVFFAIIQIIPVPVDLIRLYCLRVIPKALLVTFNAFNQCDAFVEILKGYPLYKHHAFHHTDGNLRAKLRFRARLAALDRTDKRHV